MRKRIAAAKAANRRQAELMLTQLPVPEAMAAPERATPPSGAPPRTLSKEEQRLDGLLGEQSGVRKRIAAAMAANRRQAELMLTQLPD